MATPAQELLKGKFNWLITPASVAALPVAFVSVYGAIATVDLPPGSVVPLVVSVLICAGVLGVIVNTSYARYLKTLRGVGAGKLAGTTEELKQVAREVLRLPDLVFWVNVGNWVGGAAIVATLFKLIHPVVPLASVVQLVLVANLVAPVGGLIGNVVL